MKRDLLSTKFGIYLIGVPGLISSILTIIVIIYDPRYKLLAILAIVIISLIFLFIYWLHNKTSKENFILYSSEHPALISSIELVSSDKNINSGIKVNKFVKNVCYDRDCGISRVTYHIAGRIISRSKDSIRLAIAGASDVSNLINVKYYIDKKFSIDTESHFIELNDIDLKKIEEYEYIPKQIKILNNAILYELPFPKILQKHSFFQIIFSYDWKKAIISETDSTTYLCNLMFPEGVFEFSTRLTFRNKPCKVTVKEIDYEKKMMHNSSDSRNISIKSNGGVYEIKFKIHNPKDILIIERTVNFQNNILQDRP